MSFFDTLKAMGLFQPQQGQPAQQNPYGLDPATMRQAQMSAIGNIGSQILAMSQQLTPDQRARMMAGADWTGGLQDNLYNAAQMKLMGDKQRKAQEDDQRKLAATEWLKQKVASLPDGQQKQNAMIYLQLGDLQNAAAQLTAGAPQPDWQIINGQYVDKNNPAAGARPVPGLAQDRAKPNYQLVDGYAVNMDDPNAPAIPIQGLPQGGGVDVKGQADIANTIFDDYRAQTEIPQKIVQFAQNIEDTLSSGSPKGMRALATQVLFAKVLDPGSAFMTGEADLQQKAASWTQRVSQFLQGTTEGTPIPAELVMEMRDIARQLGRRAVQKLKRIETQTKTRARSFNITDEMLGSPFEPLGNIFADPPQRDRLTEQNIPLPQDDEAFISSLSGGQ